MEEGKEQPVVSQNAVLESSSVGKPTTGDSQQAPEGQGPADQQPPIGDGMNNQRSGLHNSLLSQQVEQYQPQFPPAESDATTTDTGAMPQHMPPLIPPVIPNVHHNLHHPDALSSSLQNQHNPHTATYGSTPVSGPPYYTNPQMSASGNLGAMLQNSGYVIGAAGSSPQVMYNHPPFSSSADQHLHQHQHQQMYHQNPDTELRRQFTQYHNASMYGLDSTSPFLGGGASSLQPELAYRLMMSGGGGSVPQYGTSFFFLRTEPLFIVFVVESVVAFIFFLRAHTRDIISTDIPLFDNSLTCIPSSLFTFISFDDDVFLSIFGTHNPDVYKFQCLLAIGSSGREQYINTRESTFAEAYRRDGILE